MLSALINYCNDNSLKQHDIRSALHFADMLGIPRLLEPEDMNAEKPDERSILLYLSYFVPLGKKPLLHWVQTQIPNAQVTNLPGDWIDGKVLGALVNAVSGGKYETHAEQNGLDDLANTERVMTTAEKVLGVRKTVTPKEFTNGSLSQVARVSYLSQFYRIHTEGGAPVLIPPAPQKVEVGQIQIPKTVGEGGSVWVELDCSDAGYANVRAEVHAEQSGNIPVVVKSVNEESDRYHVIFSPPKIDIYKLSIFYADQHVTGSPFLVNLYPPDPSKVQHLDSSLPAEEKPDCSMSFDTSDAGLGKLKANASGEIGGDVPIKVSLGSNGLYSVTFLPPIPDIYTIDVLWGKFSANAIGENCGPVSLEVDNDAKHECKVTFKPPVPDVYIVDVNWDGKPIPGSPFTIDLLPPGRPEDVECTVPMYTIPGEEAEILVDASRAGSGELKAHCNGTEQGEVPMTITDLGGRTFSVSCTPENPELYTLKVTYNDKEVKDSPFTIDMRPGTEQEVGEIDEGIYRDEPETVDLQPVEESFLMNPMVQNLFEMPKNLPSQEEELYPAQKGEVESSPGPVDEIFEQKMLNDSFSDPSKCRIIGKEDVPEKVDVGSSVPLLVDASKAGQGELHVTADRPEETDNPSVLDAHLKPGENAIYQVDYTPNSHGYHKLNFKWGDHTIPDSPVALRAIDEHNPTAFEFGKPVGIDVATDSKQSDLKVKIIHKETGTPVKGKISKGRDKGKFKINFNPKTPGIYLAHVYAKDKEIPPSPFVIKYNRPIKPDACKVIDLKDSYTLGQDIDFLVDAKDAGDGILGVKAVGPRKKELAPANVKDNKDDTYSVSLKPDAVGAHKIDVLWSGQKVPHSPFSTKVKEPPSELLTGTPRPLSTYVREPSSEPPTEPTELTSTLHTRNRVGTREHIQFPSGDEAVSTTTDKAVILAVKAYTDEQQNGQLKATATNNKTGEKVKVSISKEMNVFEILLDPKVAGIYTIDATLNDQHVPNTPVAVEYTPALPIATQCKILGMEEPRPLFQVDHKICFQVDTRLAGDGKVAIKAESPSGKPKLEAKANPIDKRIIDVKYTPNVPGTHKVIVNWSGEEIPQSPLSLNVEEVPTYPYGKPVSHELELGDIDETDLSGQFYQESTGVRLKGKVNKMENNKYGFTFKPKEPGLYSLWVFEKSREIKSWPIYFYYSTPPKPEAVVVRDIPSEAYVSEPASFTVDTKKAGMSQLKVKVSPPRRGKDGELIVTNNYDGTYTVQHTPKVAGVHSFAMTWDKKTIPDSPVKYTVSKRVPTVKHSFGPGTNVMPVGQTAPLDVVNIGKHEEVHLVKASARPSKSKSKISPEITREESKCSVQFTPTVADDYTLKVLLHGSGIKGSPFNIKAVDQAVLSSQFQHPDEILPSDVESGQPTCLLVPKDENLNVKDIDVSVLGPEGHCDVQINNTLESTYGLNFVPPVPGDYLVSMNKDGKNVHGSPFKIRAAQMQLPASKAFIPSAFLNKLEETIPVGTTVDVDIDATKSVGTGLPQARLSGDGQAELKITDKGKKIYNCSITPQVAGDCEMALTMNDESIVGSPFILHFTSTPPVAEKCILKDLTELVAVNQPIRFTIDAREAGQGKLDIVPTTPSNKQDELQPTIQVTDNEDATFDVEYIPNVTGEHVFDVRWSGEEIPENPFRVPVVDEIQEINEASIAFATPLARELTEMKILLGKTLTLNVKPLNEKQRDGRLNVRVDGRDTGPGKVTVSQDDDDIFVVKFKPSEPDHYIIVIELNGEEVKTSPYYVHYYILPGEPIQEAFEEVSVNGDVFELPPTPEPEQSDEEREPINENFDAVDIAEPLFSVPTDISDPSQCRIIGKEDVPEKVDVGSSVPLLVDASKAGQGELHVTADRPEETDNPSVLDAHLKPGENAIYQVDYTPNSHGYHKLNFKWGDHTIPDSPVALRAIDEHNPTAFEFGKPVGIDVATDSKQSDLKVKIIHKETGTPVKGKISKGRDKGKFKINFNPKTPGIYLAHVYAKDKEIPPSPFVIKYNRPIKPDACKVIDLKDSYTLGQDIDFLVDAKDAGDGILGVKAVGPRKKELAPANVKDNKDDTYSVSLKPDTVGAHKIDVLWSGQKVPRSPFSTKVKEPPSELLTGTPRPLSTYVREPSSEPPTELTSTLHTRNRVGTREHIQFPSGDEAVSTTTDKSVILAVKAYTDEQQNGQLKATATNNKTGEKVKVSISKEMNVFEILLDPKVAGIYTIDATLNDQHVPNTPVAVEYTPALPIATQCKILGMEEPRPLFQVDHKICFQVDTRLAGDGKVAIKAESPSGKPKLEAKANPIDKRIIDVKYTPNVPGTHKVIVNWSGEEIPQSPLSLNVEEVPTYPYGKPVSHELELGDIDETDLSGQFYQESTGVRLKGKVNKMENNKYGFTFKPKEPGLYSLWVFEKSREIKRWPIYFYYSTPPKPEAVVVRDIPSEAYVSEPASFTVDTKKAGTSQLKVKVNPPRRGKDGELIVTNNYDGTYTVQHTPKVAGVHSFAMTWDKKTIPDSPVKYTVSKRVPTVKHSFGPGTNVMPVGQTAPLDVVNIGKHEEVHLVKASARPSKSKSKISPEITREESKCSVQFTPTVADDYTLKVLLHGSGIKGSPFNIKAVDQAVLSSQFQHPDEILPSDVESGQPTCLLVPKDENLNVKDLDVSVLGPEGHCDVQINNTLESTYGLNFVPPVPGDYLVSMKKDGEDVQGSPFKIRAAQMQLPASKAFIPSAFLNKLEETIPVGTTVDVDIDATKSVGTGLPQARLSGDGQAELKITDKGKKIYNCSITPQVAGDCEMALTMNDESIVGSPFILHFTSTPPVAENCILKDLTELVAVNQPIRFTIDAREAGQGKLDIVPTAPSNKQDELQPTIQVTDNEDATFDVEYTPNVTGEHVFDVRWSGEEIPENPFRVPVVDEIQETNETDIAFATSVSREPSEPLPVDELFEEVRIDGDVFEIPPFPEQEQSDEEEEKEGEIEADPNAEPIHEIFEAVNIPEPLFSMPEDLFDSGFSDPSKCRIIGKENVPEKVDVGSSVPLLVDASKAGQGELHVTADRPEETDNPSVLDAHLKPGENAIYQVDYTPNSHGYHKLNFKWGDHTIPDSPVALRAIDEHNPTAFEFGKPVGIDVATDSKQSDLKVKIIHKETGTPVKGKISKGRDKGKFKINFNPKTPGIYLAHVYAKDKEIPPSPFVIKYNRPIKPDACKVIDLKDSYTLGQDIDFLVDAKDAGDGILGVKAVGPRKKELAPANVKDNKDDTYSVSLKPDTVGAHKIDVLWSGQKVPHSPFSTKVKEPPSELLTGTPRPLSTYVREPSSEPPTELTSTLHTRNRVGTREHIQFPSADEAVSTTTDKSVILAVKAYTDEQQNGQLKATATNNKTGEKVKVSISKEMNVFEILLDPKVAGIYTIDATLNDQHVPNTPVAVEYAPAQPAATQCKILGMEEPRPLFQVDHKICFQVDTRLAGDGKVAIKAESPSGKPTLEANANPADAQIIDVTYTPNVPGTHKVIVNWSGEEIPQSPLSLDVERVPAYPYGKPVSHELELGDIDETDLSGQFYQESTGVRLKGKINKLENNKYGFTFKPKEPGLYSLWVFEKSREIKRWPIYFYYSIPPKPEAVVVRDIPSEVYVSEPASFIVDTKKAGMSQLKVKVSPPKKGKDGELIITDNQDFTYTVQHTPVVEGVHSFAITWDKKTVPHSPIKLKAHRREGDKVSLSSEGSVSSVNLPSLSTSSLNFIKPKILNVPKESLPLGMSVDVDIDANKSGPGSLKINQRGEGVGEVKFKNKGNSIYCCTITPVSVGMCEFDVVMNGESIEHSPFTLDFYGISGVALEGENLQIGVTHKFDIDCANVHEGNLTISCDDDDTLAANTTASFDDDKKTYNCSISPKKPGKHTISVQYNGHNIAGSPFNVDFIQPSLSNMTLSFFPTTPMDISDVSAVMEGTSDHQEIPVQFDQLLGGQSFNLDFVPTDELEYSLTVRCLVKIKQKEAQLAGGHFALGYTKQPMKCSVEGDGIETGVVGSWSSFTIQAEDGDLGELNVVFEDEKSVSSDPIITPIVPSTKYEVKYLVKKSGSFNILLNSNGKPVASSPYKVSCSLPDNLIGAEEGSSDFPTTASQGEPLQFSFKPSSQLPSNDFKVTAHSRSDEKVMGYCQASDDGFCRGTIQLEQLGKYLVEVKCDDRPIEGTPFEVNVLQPAKPENVKVYGSGLTEGRVGESGVFTIETEGAGYGKAEVNATKPEGEIKLDLYPDPEDKNKLLATYIPDVAGDYTFDVKWEGVQVPGSPFTVNILP